VLDAQGGVVDRPDLGAVPVALASGKEHVGVIFGSGADTVVAAYRLGTGGPAEGVGKLSAEGATELSLNAAGAMLVTVPSQNQVHWIGLDPSGLVIRATELVCSEPRTPFLRFEGDDGYVACNEGVAALRQGLPLFLSSHRGKVSGLVVTPLDLAAVDRASDSLLSWTYPIPTAGIPPLTGGLAADPIAIGALDVNADGKQDLVVLTQSSRTLEVLIDTQ
jgi:hypothetical protein